MYINAHRKRNGKFWCCAQLFQRYVVTLAIQPSHFVCTTQMCSNIFVGRIHVHSFEPPSEKFTFFCHTIVSEVRAQHPHYPLFQSPSKLIQTTNFKMGRTATRQYNPNTPKIVTVGPVYPKIVRSELWRRNL